MRTIDFILGSFKLAPHNPCLFCFFVLVAKHEILRQLFCQIIRTKLYWDKEMLVNSKLLTGERLTGAVVAAKTATFKEMLGVNPISQRLLMKRARALLQWMHLLYVWLYATTYLQTMFEFSAINILHFLKGRNRTACASSTLPNSSIFNLSLLTFEKRIRSQKIGLYFRFWLSARRFRFEY